MRTHLLFVAACVFCAEATVAQENPFSVTYTFDTTGPTVCGINESPTIDPDTPYVVASDFSRVGIDCEDDIDDGFGGIGFDNVFDNEKRFSFVVMSSSFQNISFDETDVLSLIALRTLNGPDEMRIVMRVYNPETGTVGTTLDTLALTTAATFYSINLPEKQGGNAAFEFQPRYSSGLLPDPQGAVYLDEVSITGTELPVELTAFSALTDDDAVELRWTTASETNNAGFDVQMQRSDDWRTLGFVQGAGTTAEARHYAYRTDALTPGRYRFRLRQVDFDGAFEFSDEVEVAVVAAPRLTLSAPRPNPASQSVVQLSSDRTRQVRVAVYDVLGRRMAVAFEGTLEAGAAREVVLNAAAWGLSSGVYFVRAEGAAEVQAQAFIVR